MYEKDQHQRWWKTEIKDINTWKQKGIPWQRQYHTCEIITKNIEPTLFATPSWSYGKRKKIRPAYDKWSVMKRIRNETKRILTKTPKIILCIRRALNNSGSRFKFLTAYQKKNIFSLCCRHPCTHVLYLHALPISNWNCFGTEAPWRLNLGG